VSLHGRALLVLLSLALASTSSTVAADAPDLWRERPTVLELHLGVGTPVGFIGLSLDHAPVRWLSGSAGFGLGSGRDGGSLHVALGGRARLFVSDTGAFYFGADYSTGEWILTDVDLSFVPAHGSSPEPQFEMTIYSNRMHWIQGSVGYEKRRESGLTTRVYIGAARMLNPSSRRCAIEPLLQPCVPAFQPDFGSPVIGVVGLAVGTSF
jgi:hypothetical protein